MASTSDVRVPPLRRRRVFGAGPLLLVALVSACSAPPPDHVEPRYVVSASADPSDEFFAVENLLRLDLELPPETLRRLRERPDEYAVGTLRYRDQTLEAIGVRLKGEASFRELDDKPAFRLKLDKFVPGR